MHVNFKNMTSHLVILNLLQSLAQGPPSSPDSSGSNRYLFIFKPADRPFKNFDEYLWKSDLLISSQFLTTVEASSFLL